MKKEKNITYEELMNSHFMKFPGHSKVLHYIFDPIAISIYLFILISLVGYLYGVGLGLSIFIAAVSVISVILKQSSSYHTMTGHGVGLKKKGKFSILGLSTALSIGFLIISSLSLVMVLGSFSESFNKGMMDYQTVLNFRALSLSFFICTVFSLLSWRFHIYYETWYGSQYDAMIECKNKGMSVEQTEQFIENLRKAGILY